MPRVCLAYAYTHLSRKPYAISVRARRTASPLPTDQESAPYGLFLTLLLLISGVVGSWGQDYSGTYYFANNNKGDYKGYDNASNFYLCPAQEYFVEDGLTTTTESNGKPFLTTYKTRQAENALWIVEADSYEDVIRAWLNPEKGCVPQDLFDLIHYKQLYQ
jgi:hypothetical protein